MAYFECSALAVGCAFNGLHQRLTTWPTVQLYYSVFYALRGLLALSGCCIFYLGNSPFYIEALSGQNAERPPGGRRSATTHGAVLESFKKRLSSHSILSQDIEGMNPLDWLSARRVSANMMAYPLRTLGVVRDELVAQKAYILDDEVRLVLSGLFRDKRGVLGEMVRFFE
jgi:hypothetical protein